MTLFSFQSIIFESQIPNSTIAEKISNFRRRRFSTIADKISSFRRRRFLDLDNDFDSNRSIALDRCGRMGPCQQQPPPFKRRGVEEDSFVDGDGEGLAGSESLLDGVRRRLNHHSLATPAKKVGAALWVHLIGIFTGDSGQQFWMCDCGAATTCNSSTTSVSV